MPRDSSSSEHAIPLLGPHPRTKYITPSLVDPVEVDPKAPGTIIRYALIVEILLNLFMGISLAFYPKWLLDPVLSDPSSFNQPATFTICQWTGAIILAFTIQIALLLPNTRSAMECRRLVYWMLTAGEGCLIPLFVYQTFRGSDRIGFQRNFLLTNAFMFGLHMVWRLFCLLVRPDWFGRYRDVRE